MYSNHFPERQQSCLKTTGLTSLLGTFMNFTPCAENLGEAWREGAVLGDLGSPLR